MRKVKAEDLYESKFVSKVQWNKAATKAVFTVHTTDEASNSYKADAWMLEDGKLTRLTASGDVAGVQWLDENTLFFAGLRTAEDKAAAKTAPLSVFHKLSLCGGEAAELVRIPMKVLDLKPMGANKFALLAIYDRYPAEDRNPGWEVFDELPFWRNGEGYTSGTRKRLYIMDNGKLTPVTAENEGVTSWAVDNGKILYASQVYEDVVGMTAGITLYANGMKQVLVEDGIYNVGGVFFLDGKPMGVLNDRVEWGSTKNPLFYDLSGCKPVAVSTMDEHPAGTVVGDSAYGGGAQLVCDEGYIYYTTVDDTKSVLRRLKDGNLETLLTTYGSLDAIAVKNGKILVSSVGQAKLPELYSVENGELTQLTQFNEQLYNERTIQMPHPVSAQSGDWQINGYVIYPADYEEGKTYPAILDIHGGPFGAYGAQYFHEMQVWSGAGYFVFYCNPRGGDGRGNAFADLRGQYGKIDYDDIMAFTYEVLKQFPQIDQNRVGVTGGSYGGFMTNWIIGHTDLFKAACAQRSISNWISKFLCTDNGYLYNAELLQGNPWEDTDKLWWASPLKYAANAKTPTLFIQSDQDYRCWMAECIQMFSTLKLHGVDSRICLFHGENHNLSRVGKPINRVRRINEITTWMDKYLK